MSATQFEKCTPSPGIPVPEVTSMAFGWLLDGEYRQLSQQTQYGRKLVLDKLVAWLAKEGRVTCGSEELRGFLASVSAGRASSPTLAGRANRPITTKTYHSRLHAFFAWCIAEGLIAESPLARVRAPISRQDQVQPFTEDQIQSLLQAARRSPTPRRDEALILFALDTAVRATELCTLRTRSVCMTTRQATVMGKGNKQRTVYFSPTTARALWKYTKESTRAPGDPVFASDRGGGPLTRSGFRQIILRLGRSAGLEAVRCSPHTLRHSAAVIFLRAGGNPFALQSMLGHTSLTTTRRYVALAQADVQAQHTLYSPVEALKRR